MDAKLTFKEISPGVGYFDIGIAGADLERDSGLETAVIISLFTDRRAEADDILPDGSDDRRGYWGDQYAEVEGDLLGSRLWLLDREKQLPGVVQRAKQYAEEALAWLVEDGVAAKVIVTAEIPRPGMLGLVIEIHKPDGQQLGFRFSNLWDIL